MKKIVIIGGVAGGATVAARLRRLDETSEIIILERGPHVSFANCGLPYFVGGEIKERDDLLLHTPSSLKARFNLDVRVLCEVTTINPQNNSVSYKELNSQKTIELGFDQLIISTGAAPLRPALPGLDLDGIFTLRDVPDVEKIKLYIESNKVKTASVVGGGYVGLEMLEQLQHLGLKTTLVEAAPHVLRTFDPEMAELVQREITAQKIETILSDPIEGVELSSQDSKQKLLKLKSGRSIASDLIILAIGVRPETALAKAAGLEIGTRGGIKVNAALQTSANNIWAIGDCIEVTDYITKKPALIALAGPANRQARIVADNIYGAQKSYDGTLGTSILRVFNLTAASTGATERTLNAEAIPYLKVYLHPMQHVSYYPGAEPIALKVLFSEDQKILGAQAIGKEGVDKRIDLLAAAIKSGTLITDLINYELCYAPPYGAAKDPINLIGMLAENVLTKKVQQTFANEITDQDFLLDVRSSAECSRGIIKTALNIPLPELRSRLGELPKDKIISVYCQSGQRSYFACRLLSQHGFNVKNLSGAYKTWSQFQPPRQS
jgi:NADPH-dependent 2,4-dienoyl-CoA reductase/sulfur reductase-like enzyme/rhodanese-related sulfurtransferase